MVIAGQDKLSREEFHRYVPSTLFFILLFLLVYLWIDPKLIYHRQGQYLLYQVYVPGVSLFSDLPEYPGKAVEYISGWLSRYYYYSLAGALIITAIALILSWETDKLVRVLGGDRLRALRFVPAILVVVQYGRYYQYLAGSLALIVTLLFVYIYTRIPLRNAVFRFAVFLVFSALMYPVAIESYLVFVALCGIFECFNRRARLIGLLCFLSAVLVPYVISKFVLDLNLFDAYFRVLPFDPETDIIGLVTKFIPFLFFPVAAVVCVFWGLFRRSREAEGGGSRQIRRFQNRKSHKGKSGQAWDLWEHYRKSESKWLLKTLALLIITSVTVLLAFDSTARKHRRIDYFATHKMWDSLLREARKLPARYYDVFDCHDVNRALYHKGRLLYDMFSYPQHHSGLLLTIGEKDVSSWILVRKWVKRVDTLYELGHINEAKRFTYEAFAVMNSYPKGMQRLALIHIIKGQIDSARTILLALRKDFLYKDWAERYLERLESDPLLSTDKEFQHIRSLTIVKNYVNDETTPKDLFLRNEYNHMAFEYLMAFCLLTGQYAPAAQSIEYLNNFNYPKGEIPRHLEEAILLYTRITGKSANLYGRRIKTKTIHRFEEFLRRSQYYKDDMQAAKKALAKDFGDTYYYYHLLVMPGLEK